MDLYGKCSVERITTLNCVATLGGVAENHMWLESILPELVYSQGPSLTTLLPALSLFASLSDVTPHLNFMRGAPCFRGALWLLEMLSYTITVITMQR